MEMEKRNLDASLVLACHSHIHSLTLAHSRAQRASQSIKDENFINSFRFVRVYCNVGLWSTICLCLCLCLCLRLESFVAWARTIIIWIVSLTVGATAAHLLHLDLMCADFIR